MQGLHFPWENGWEAEIPHASQPKNQKRKQKQYGSKFNKDFKNGPHQKIFKKIITFIAGERHLSRHIQPLPP